MPVPGVVGVVSRVRLYPVKSLAGVEVATATVEPWGLRGDRRWMVVDASGGVLTARERHALLSVRATPDDEGGLTLAADGSPPLHVPVPTGPADVPVGLSRLDRATAAGHEADRWLSDVLAERVRLVWLDDPRRRPLAPAHGGRDGDTLSLADAGPLLLVSLLVEPGALAALGEAGPRAWIGVSYSALVASLLGHGVYFLLLQRHPVAQLTPWMLLTPLLAVVLGVVFWGDEPGVQLWIGGALVLGGVATIALRAMAKARQLPPAGDI